MSLHDMSVFAGGRRVNLILSAACIIYVTFLHHPQFNQHRVGSCLQAIFFRSVTNTKFVG